MLATPGIRIRQWAARVYQTLHWTGCLGVSFLFVALFVGLEARRARDELAATDLVDAPVVSSAPAPIASAVGGPALPQRADIGHTLEALRQLALDAQFPWGAAEYRWIPGSESQVGRLEIRCQLKGPYLKVRKLLLAWRAHVAGFLVQDLSITRTNAETEEVEAKFVLAVLMADVDVATGSAP